MSDNAAIICQTYEDFAEGNVPAVLAAMAPDIEWNEAENFPYAAGNPYRGPQAVLDGVFMPINTDFDGFTVRPGEIVDAGDTIIMLGRYTGTHRATGKALDAQVAHVWRLRDGKITRFQQYADTLHTARVTGAV